MGQEERGEREIRVLKPKTKDKKEKVLQRSSHEPVQIGRDGFGSH